MARKEGSSSTWRHKYRLTLINDYTFKEVWKVKLTKLDFLSLSGSFIILLIVLVTILISFTNLREFIPGYPDGNQRRNIVLNALLLDSLQKELEMRDRYFENMRRIVSGEEPVDYESEQDTSMNYKDLSFTRSLEDSLLRHQIEQEEQYNLAVIEVEANENRIPDLRFFTPLKGMITSKFNVLENHYGTDVVGIPGAIIHATLDGTVILASWTLDTGYVLQIQHKNNLISVYKHNAGLLKDVGAHVEVGESIAILGDSGELYTSGPHLHFELWLNGTPIDPEKHVVF